MPGSSENPWLVDLARQALAGAVRYAEKRVSLASGEHRGFFAASRHSFRRA